MNDKVLGAIAGDMIGSTYEFHNVKTVDFNLFPTGCRFTDDTVMTLAVARWLLCDATHSPDILVGCMQQLGRRYPNAGYGAGFRQWLQSESPRPYNSCGNGSAMRVSPVGLYAETLDEALQLARISAEVTHNHPEGIKGAQAVAACMFLCRDGKTKDEVRGYVESVFGYDLSRTIAEIRPGYRFDALCQGSVPEAITAFLEGNTFEEVVRLAVSLGGDSDTIACMAGAIASCSYPISLDVVGKCDDLLTAELRTIKDDFLRMIGRKRGFMGIVRQMFL